MTETLRRWGVTPGTRVVLYDDVGQIRHAIRGYWLLRLYRFPADRVHVLDGGLPLWLAEGRPARPPSSSRRGRRRPSRSANATRRWSPPRTRSWPGAVRRRPPGGRTRILDVRRADEYLGVEVASARSGHDPRRAAPRLHRLPGPGRSAAARAGVALAAGGDRRGPGAIFAPRTARAACGQPWLWFVPHELAGLAGGPQLRASQAPVHGANTGKHQDLPRREVRRAIGSSSTSTRPGRWAIRGYWMLRLPGIRPGASTSSMAG